MSNVNPFVRKSPAQPTLPRGDILGTYDTYLEAQKVVDRLSKADFPVEQIAIVGNDLKTVERVTGKLTNGRAAISGAASGAWLGLFVGLLLFLFAQAPVIEYVFAAMLIGAGFGMLFGIVTYSLSRRRRDFTSTHQVLASNYQVIIDPTLAAQALEVLARPEASPSTD